MSRILTTLGLILMVLAGSAGIWGVSHRPTVPFLVRGATDIEVVAPRSNERQISYHAPGLPSTWYADLGRQLEQAHWQSPDHPEYGPLNRTFMHASSIGIVEVQEWVFMHLDLLQPQAAHIRQHREVVFPWWPRVLRTAERWLDVAEGWVQGHTDWPHP